MRGEDRRFEDRLGDWEPRDFEAHGREVLGLIRNHFEHIRDMPVGGSPTPEELFGLLDSDLPENAEPFPAVLDDTREKVIPNLTQWNHPSFHAYFSISSSFPGILAETLASALNVNAMLYRSGPAASVLESVVLRWMAEMIGYPASADGVLVNGASLGTFYALAAARASVPGLNVREKGLAGCDAPRLRIYTSDQAHSSVDKAAIALGVGLENVVRVPSDESYRLRPELLEAEVESDLGKGFRPMAVVATVGTTSVGAVDPLGEIAQICCARDLWLHVDAAWGGFWNLVPDVRERVEDLGLGDSMVVNPHKCLYAPLEVTCLYCRRRDALLNTFRLVPEYLKTSPEDGSVDYMNYSLQLGRSFRALKLWWIIRSFGRAGLERRLAESIRLARWLEEQISAHPDFECPAGSPFALVCLRYFPRDLRAEWERATPERKAEIGRRVDALNAELLGELNGSGIAFASHAVIREGYVIRIAIGNIRTMEDDMRRLWDALQRLGPAMAHASCETEGTI
jgi:aromatic-L-amino-acid decarboxylase